MKTIVTFIILSIFCIEIYAQTEKQIVVTGSAEMYIVPDEFIFEIGIEEYWEEEFEKNTKFKDYKTKVDIALIEQELMKDLLSIGITKAQIKATEVGNYWRYSGKEFLISKRFEVTLTDFALINTIVAKVQRKGLDYMRIGELKNKDLQEYRKEVKKQALLAAKEKATYLVETLDEKLGGVITITELDDSNFFWGRTASRSNVALGTNDASADTEKKIKLRYEIQATFAIQ